MIIYNIILLYLLYTIIIIVVLVIVIAVVVVLVFMHNVRKNDTDKLDMDMSFSAGTVQIKHIHWLSMNFTLNFRVVFICTLIDHTRNLCK